MPAYFGSRRGLRSSGAVVLPNLLTFASEFDNAAWQKGLSGMVTVTANQTVAPDGSSTADLAVPNASAGFHSLQRSPATTAAVHTHEVYVKAAGYTKVGIREDLITGQYGTFDCSGAGSVIASSGATASITALANSWYLIRVIPAATSLNMGSAIYIMNAAYAAGDPSSHSYTGDGTSGVYLWRARVFLGG
jgi:hypothetical protein